MSTRIDADQHDRFASFRASDAWLEAAPENLRLLENRQRGTRYIVDKQSGQLTTLKGFNLFRYYVDARFRAEVKADVKMAINLAVTQKDHKKDHIAIQGKALEDIAVKEVHTQDLKKLFFTTLAPLGTDVFDRSVIASDILKRIDPTNYVPGFTNEGVDVTAPPVGFYENAVKTAQLALKLGVRPRCFTGSWRAPMMLKDLSGKTILVAKNTQEKGLSSTPWLIKMKQVAKDCLFSGIHSVAFFTVEKEGKAEVAASCLSELSGLNNVPQTRKVQFELPGGETFTGVAQLFAKDATAATEMFKDQKSITDTKKSSRLKALCGRLNKEDETYMQVKESELDRCSNECFKNSNQHEFEKMAILDIVLGNLDRHFANYLFTKEGKIVAIDNGKALSDRHSKSFDSLQYQYLWRLMPEAKEKLSSEAKAKIEKIYNMRNTLVEGLQEAELIDNNQARCMLNRIELLHHYAERGDKTLYDMALVRTQEQFDHALPPGLVHS